MKNAKTKQNCCGQKRKKDSKVGPMKLLKLFRTDGKEKWTVVEIVSENKFGFQWLACMDKIGLKEQWYNLELTSN